MADSQDDTFKEMIVGAIREETPTIRTFELVPADADAIVPFEAGAHVLVKTPNRLIRNYSLCNSPAESHRYLIAVKHEENGRGGSRSMFDVVEGARLLVSPPRNLFRLPQAPGRVILVAGGIGITPIVAMVHALRRQNIGFTLHYCTRAVEEAAFYGMLRELSTTHAIHFHHDDGDPSKALAFGPLFKDREAGTDLYCCGPHGLMSAVRAATAHWPATAVHFEDFQPPAIGDAAPNRAFTVTVQSTGETFTVPPDKSILEVLNENGFDVWSSCEQGTCATCKTRLIAGVADHRDRVLDEVERRDFITVCVSRAISDNLVLEPE